MKPMKVTTAMACPCCEEIFDGDDGSQLEDHTPERLPEAWECGECGELHEDKDEAKECCR